MSCQVPEGRAVRVHLLGVPVTSSNRGVLALASSLVALIRQAAPDADITLLIGHPRHETVPFRVGNDLIPIEILPCRLSPRSALRDHLFWIVFVAIVYRLSPTIQLRAKVVRLAPWVDAIANSDFVGDIRGGDSFSDIYGLSRFLYGFALASVVLLVRGEIVQLPQTYGPYTNPIAKVLAKFLLRHSSIIIARDRHSHQVASDLVEDKGKVLLSPDVAFSLPMLEPKRLLVDPPTVGNAHGPMVGLNINGLMYNGGYAKGDMFRLRLNYPRFLLKLIMALLEEQTGDVLLIPHVLAEPGDVESDPEACRKVRDGLPVEFRHRVRILFGDYDERELKYVIAACKFFVGSRMHACIAALSQGVPCVGVAYSSKFAGVFDSVGMASWIVDARLANEKEAIKQVVELYRQRDYARADLRFSSDLARRRLQELFCQLPLRRPSQDGHMRRFNG